MGKDTVSNQDRAIATRGTKHKATTVDKPDMCYAKTETPDKATPFPNHIYTFERLDPGTNTSSKTLINNNRIWIDGGRVGKIGGLESMESHPPKNQGQRTQTWYRKEAWNTSCSTEVFAEGKGVVRTDDTTAQNKENTTGKVDGSEVEVTDELTEAFYKNACKIKILKGEVKAEKGGGAKLQKKRKTARKEDYLEVYNGETVELEVTRVDATKSPEVENPTCQLEGDHAHWRAQREYDGEVVEGEKGTGDKYTIDKALTDVGLELSSTTISDKTDAGKGQPGGGGAGNRTGRSAGMTLITPGQFIRFFRCQKNPPLITVGAKACGGEALAYIAVKPKGGFKVSITLENEGTRPGANDDKTSELGAFGALLEKIRKIDEIVDKIKAVEKISRPKKMLQANRKPNVINFLTGVTLELGCEYKRCEKTDKDFTPAHIRRAWYFKIEGELLKIELSVEVPLDTFAGSFIGGPAGAAVAKAMNRAGISIVFATFTAGLTFTVNGQLGWDQHDAFVGGETGFGGAIVISFEAKVTVDVFLVEFSIGFKVSVPGEANFRPADRPGILMYYNWNISVGSTLFLTGRVWRFEKTVTFEGPGFKPDPKRQDIPLPG